MGLGRILKVMVFEGSEEPKVEITLPLKLAKWALTLLPVVKSKLEDHVDVDLEALRELLNEGFDELAKLEDFDLVKVNDGDTQVRISIEA